jgi:hypothetical protein
MDIEKLLRMNSTGVNPEGEDITPTVDIPQESYLEEEEEETELSPQEKMLEEYRLYQQMQGDSVAAGREADADIALLDSLNKAGAQANQAMSSGYANIKVKPIDLGKSNLGDTARKDSESRINNLMKEYKLMQADKKKELTPDQKEAQEIKMRKLRYEDQNLGKKKELTPYQQREQDYKLGKMKYEEENRGKEKELTPEERLMQEYKLNKMKYEQDHRGEVSEYDQKEQDYKNRLLDNKIADEGKVKRNTKYMNTPSGLVEIDENTGEVRVIKESSIREDREKRLVKREEQRQKERVSNEIIGLRKTLNKDPRFTQITKEGMSFDQVDNLTKLAEKGNQTAFGALGTKMARAMGEVGVLTDADVVRYVRGGSLSRKAADVLSTWKDGRPSKASIDDIKQISRILKEIHGTKIAPLYDEFAKTAYENLPISKYEAYKRLSLPIPPSLEKAKVFFKKNKAKLNKMGINNEREAEAYLKEQGKL